ncbi:MAG: chemotaxis protein CheD [Clostridia bacterium]|nr:chemotaxis protein CheD [Clostridia bacterium]MDD4798381.1 chemotaxis protein CheD [Clostridia bacterium]
MEKKLVVGISDQQIAFPSDCLITYALGSCVGICLYDQLKRISGLAHILLPESFNSGSRNETYKFADTAIAELVNAMEKQGSSRNRLVAKIAGGASMFVNSTINIGERNVEAVKRELNRLNIKLIAEDTGLNYGRTVKFSSEDGKMTVTAIGKGIKIL